MIARIETRTEYGKRMQNGSISPIETSEECTTVFAHSVQDALDWINKYPLYDNAVIDDMADGRYYVRSVWQQYDNSYDMLFDNQPDRQYIRSVVLICPCNTIYEQVGFRPA